MNIFDKYYLRYDKWYDKNKEIFETELNALKKFEIKGDSIEIGVGTGRFAQRLGIGFGVDVSEKMLSLAKERGINTVKANGEDMPFKDNWFDNAAIIFSICFIKNPLQVLKETNRILKKKGSLILGIIDRGSSWGKYLSGKKGPFYKNTKFYTPKELIDMCKKTGFSYIESWQSLFQDPEEFNKVEIPRPGYGKGGFVGIRMEK
ncbi:MAG: class I SAM-dependent methyltransferase [Elusimicrobiota bacterium]